MKPGNLRASLGLDVGEEAKEEPVEKPEISARRIGGDLGLPMAMPKQSVSPDKVFARTEPAEIHVNKIDMAGETTVEDVLAMNPGAGRKPEPPKVDVAKAKSPEKSAKYTELMTFMAEVEEDLQSHIESSAARSRATNLQAVVPY